MSDPLAVYTQADFGITDKGANIKIGQTYQSSQPGTMAMNFIEIKGIDGDLFGMLQLFPLAGAGVTIANDFSSDGKGYEIPGTFTVVGIYSKIELTDKIWVNYNSIHMYTLSVSSQYKDAYYAGEDNIFTHEFVLSYQINPRVNIRYFANWNEHVNFGDHRIEFN